MKKGQQKKEETLLKKNMHVSGAYKLHIKR